MYSTLFAPEGTMNTASDNTSGAMKTQSLAVHVRSKLLRSLEKWGGSISEKEKLASSIVAGIERDMQETVFRRDFSDRLRNRVYVDAVDTVAKAFSVHPHSAPRLLDGADPLTVSAVVRGWSQGRQQARKVYEDITVHHQRLMDAPSKSSSSTRTAAVTASSFDAYADAAKAMGDRVWVAEANRYMFNFCVNYFRFGGSRKLFVRQWVEETRRTRADRGDGEAAPLLSSSSSSLAERVLRHRADEAVFSRDLLRLRRDKRVRVLDVGSCYNPFAKLDRDLHVGAELRVEGAGESFKVGDPCPLADAGPVEKTEGRFVDVTALDLHPSTPASVHQCDFLELRVGPEDSAPVITGAAADSLGSIEQLPAHSFDAVTMCLVLCYLPAPAQRLAMVAKARRLLRNPPAPSSSSVVVASTAIDIDSAGFPRQVTGDAELKDVLQRYYSDSGLLVIAEKESIVGSVKANAANAARALPSPDAPPVTELLAHWKQAISQVGFQCIRYHNVVCTADKHKYHLFVFKTTVPAPAPEVWSASAGRGLYIRQDYGNICAADTASVSSSESSIRSPATPAATPATIPAAVSGAAETPAAASDGVAPEVAAVFGAEPSLLREFVLCKADIKKMIAREDKQRSCAAAVATSEVDAGTATAARALRVGIIGAGIGGLTLANCLQQLRIPYRVFERDAHVSSRRQGYGLTMQQANGVLQSLGLFRHICADPDSSAGGSAGGAVSTSHASYDHRGALLGAYGVDVEVYGQDGRLEKRPEFNNSTLKLRGAPSCGSDSDSEDSSGSDCGGAAYSVEVNSHNKRDRAVQALGPRRRGSTVKTVSRQNTHVPRQTLREVLLRGAETAPQPVGGVSWDKLLVGLEAEPRAGAVGEKLRLTFQDGTTDVVDVLVGADGIFSKVREQLECGLPSSAPLRRSHNLGRPLKYLGLMVILGIAPYRDVCGATADLVPRRSQHQWLDGRVDAAGDSSALGANCRVFAMPYDGERTMWQVSFLADEAAAIGLASTSNRADGSAGAAGDSAISVGERLKQAVLDLIEDWPAPLVRLISSTPADVVTGYPIYDRDPPEDQSEAEAEAEGALSRCVLIGDAAHPMSPFKGQGANQAVLDAHLLAAALEQSLAQDRAALPAQLRRFERAMYARATPKVLKSRAAAEFLHSPRGLRAGNVTRAAAAAGIKNPFESKAL